jgi:hypothetical protein
VNLAEAQQAVLDRGFDYLDPSRTALMLNTAKDTFEDVWEWPWLVKSITGPTPLTIDDLKLITTVKLYGTQGELLGLDARQALQGNTDPSLPGSPMYWWMQGDVVLNAWPGSGAVVTVLYIADSPPLSLPTDTPLIPARYHGLWIDYAVCEAYKDSDNFPAAQALRADIGFRMQDVITRYETRNRQHSPFMTQRSFAEDD